MSETPYGQETQRSRKPVVSENSVQIDSVVLSRGNSIDSSVGLAGRRFAPTSARLTIDSNTVARPLMKSQVLALRA